MVFAYYCRFATRIYAAEHVVFAVAYHPRFGQIDIEIFCRFKYHTSLGLAAAAVEFEFGDFARVTFVRVVRAEIDCVQIRTLDRKSVV